MARIALVHDVAGVAAVQAELLRSAGHDVDEIALPAFGASWRWPAKGLALPFRLAAYVPAITRLRNGRYDVVHIHWLTHGIVGILSGREFFVQAHGSDLHMNLNNPVYRWVTRAVLKSAKRVFYVTPNLRVFLGEYEEKLYYLPNPVDMRGIAQSSTPPASVSTLLIFTRLDRVKGVDRVFPAVERLSKRIEITALDWGPLAHEYVRKYREWVSFVPRVPHRQIGPFLNRFDAIIGQMRQGILSLMEIEALAAGRPTITAVNWKLYPDDPPPVIEATQPEELAAAVETLRAASAEELAEISRRSRDWAFRNHSYGHHLELLQAAYFGERNATS